MAVILINNGICHLTPLEEKFVPTSILLPNSKYLCKRNSIHVLIARLDTQAILQSDRILIALTPTYLSPINT